MEDVVVQRTTVRSTTQNPTPKKNGSVYIQGDNITIGTMIVNSPNARVDNSTNTVQVQQNNQPSSNTDYNSNTHRSATGFSYPSELPKPLNQPGYHSERDFFKKISPHIITLIPNILMMR
jgi:hypothetical protein